MAKSNLPTRFSDELKEVAEILARRRGYRDRSDYIRSLVRYDALVGGEDHAITKPIADKSLSDQDRIDKELLHWVKKGAKGRGVLLDRMIQKALDGGANSETEVKKKIAENF